jgi:2-polyprenyl-3-methyl-5-hydroxy-6-metoxy-1,4-benzoquinol methylase
MKGMVGWPQSERKVLPVEGKGRLLDFGCGGGSYLARMHRQGWQVTGLDISPEAVRRVREELHLPALVGSFPCWELASGSFDVITMWQVLEHVHDPLEVLREAYRLLTPGGKLVISVPNIDSLPFRLFGSYWLSLDLPRHLTHFTPSTLHLMLEHAGFRVHPIRMVRHSQWLRASAKLACTQKRVRPWQRWLRAKPVSRFTTWYGYLTQQSDCLLVNAER